MTTAGRLNATGVALPARSVTVTVTVPAAPAVVGVPLITPVPASMVSPAGSPGAPYDARSMSVVTGLTAGTSTSTCNEPGGV